MNKKKVLARLLRSLAQCIESSSAEEIDDLLAGQRRLEIESAGPGRTQMQKPKNLVSSARDWTAIADQLKGLPSREEGQSLIQGLSLKRKELESLARAMNLPVSKDDSIERLRQKIIESSIGSRLASQAIRGE
jgi:hypothetical protein